VCLALLCLAAVSSLSIAGPARLDRSQAPEPPDADQQQSLQISGRTMGSHYIVTIDSPGDVDADSVQQEIETRFEDINRQLSNWDPRSEISRFNSSDIADWFPVSTDFVTIAQEAGRLHELTSGALDPTLAPLIDAWGFGATKPKVAPSEEQISAALGRTGWQHLEIREDPPAIRRLRPGVQLNLSSLAPGFAADEVGRILRRHGWKSYVVDVGGETLAGESRRSGAGWRLGVESPLGGLERVVEVTSQAIATSGDYRNVRLANGRRVSHILDPATGRPVENPPAQVSVLHPSCMTADGLATAMMVLGTERGLKLAEQLQVDVMFLEVSNDGEIVEHSTGRFRESATE
jgi:thiamine biosynthesis lipoprotein